MSSAVALARNPRFVEMYKNKASQTEMCRVFRCCHRTVAGAIDYLGYTRRPRSESHDEAPTQEEEKASIESLDIAPLVMDRILALRSLPDTEKKKLKISHLLFGPGGRECNDAGSAEREGDCQQHHGRGEEARVVDVEGTWWPLPDGWPAGHPVHQEWESSLDGSEAAWV